MYPKFTSLKNQLAAAIVFVFICSVILGNSAGTITPGGNGGRTGASFDLGTCGSVGCHSGGTFTPSVTITLLSGTSPVTTYVPGASYTLRIKVSILTITTLGYHYGFQTVCVQSSTYNDINDWGILPAGTHIASWSTRTYVEQSATILSTTTPLINIPWTAPVAGTGSVTFYAGGCVVNNDHAITGDNSVNSNITITESTTGCVPPTLVATPTGISCHGAADGSISLAATGGTGVTGYLWTGPGSYTATTSGISGLSAGTYTVVVTATGGCTASTTATIIEPAVLSATLSSNAPVCPGATLSFTCTPTGGTSPYTYSWSGPAGFTSGLANPSIPGVTVARSGTYTLLLTDAHSCTATQTLSVTVNPQPVVALGNDTSICPGDSITLNAGNPGDIYLWSTGAATQTIRAGTTSYYVAVTNSFGCIGRDTINISVGCPAMGINNVILSKTTLYPNPANDYITIQNNGNFKPQQITICNEYGAIVFDKVLDFSTDQKIDVASLPIGVYIVKLKRDGNELVSKLVIAR